MADPNVFVVPGQIKGWVAPFRSGFKDSFTATVKAAGAATGGRLLAFTDPGDRLVDTAGAGSKAVAGLAMHDAAAGELVTVARDGVWPCIAAGAIKAGDKLVPAANGTVAAIAAADVTSLATLTPGVEATRTIIGEAESTAADTATVRVRLNV